MGLPSLTVSVIIGFLGASLMVGSVLVLMDTFSGGSTQQAMSKLESAKETIDGFCNNENAQTITVQFRAPNNGNLRIFSDGEPKIEGETSEGGSSNIEELGPRELDCDSVNSGQDLEISVSGRYELSKTNGRENSEINIELE